tara:strand:+ start:531 stop:1784 length:1254 start_codon:yes stop_codon:yes gene_type:complete
MKKSIIFAFIIFLLTIGWLASGQFGKVIANEESEKILINEDSSTDYSSSDSSQNNDENFENTIKVESKLFVSEQIDQSILLQGQTIHNRTIDVKSETTGNIIKINFNRGDFVKSNEESIKLSMEDRREQYNSFLKDLERLNKELVINKKNRDNLLNKNKEQIKLYEIEYASAKQLIDKGLSSKSKLSLASFNLANAKSDQVDINLNYESNLANLESQIISTKSKIKNIEIDINKTKVSVPFDGIVNNKYVEIGDFVRPGDILFTIVDLNPIKIQGYLSEFDESKVKIGTKAMVENANAIKKNGIITFISPTAETNTRTFEIIIEADNSDFSFKSGITTSIIIKGSELLAHKIPPSILTLKDDGTVGVKAVDNSNTVVFYPITKVKDTIDGMWVSGLPAKVKLITSGQEYVSVGQIIN